MAVSREEANVSLKKLKGMLFEDVKYFKKLNGCFLEMFIQPAFHFTSRNLQRVGGGYKSSCNVEPSLTKESSDGETLKDRL
ncbi:hypothetical protein F8388_000384 [Cannabis sativa]|uniref:Uncharacterized protein n=1 Tax=Cannabis sativa TaxID=3483 RepID=A0A7J6DYK8_CANSA|nr:hypothetical protein F8388_000384 [Cannabis sativa]